ncbi:MAG: hypothetical protein ACYTFY_05870 [Planctomycetota bacterium]|jgi:hypothetical protein
MKIRNTGDLKAAFLLLGAAFLCSIPFLAGYKPIPDELKKKRIASQAPSSRKSVKSNRKKIKRKAIAVPKKIAAVKGEFKPLTKSEIVRDEKVKWKVVFSDNFFRDSLDDKWNYATGKWRVSMGVLKTTSLNSASTIMVKDFKFPESFRISYDCKTVKPGDSKVPCDMSFFTYVDLPAGPKKAPSVSNSYLFRVATHNNTFCGLSRPGAYLVVNKRFKLKTGRVYRVVCQKIGSHLMMSINGKKVFHGKETKPHKFSEKQLYGGIYVHRTFVEFDNFEISVPKK